MDALSNPHGTKPVALVFACIGYAKELNYRKRVGGVSMERFIQVLRRFNYTESEAKVYIALLQNGPQTGYEVSKLSGVPRSKVYNVLESLTGRGVVATTPGAKTVMYRAEPVQRLSDLIKSSVRQGIQDLQREAEFFSHPIDDEQIWKLSGYDSILDKCREMISSSRRELMIQIWTDELTGEIEELLLQKEKTLDLLVILYDSDEKYRTRLKQVYPHGFENDRIRETGYRWITIAADGEQMLHASIRNSAPAEAVYTRNASMVYFSEEYVRHDAYCLRLIDAMPVQVREKFGEDMEGIRDVFAIR